MTTLTFRRPTVLPVHPKGWVRPPGNIDFIITQDFDDPDFINPAVTHRAVDLGNFRCGDSVVAMHAGRAYLVNDAAGALGVVVDHGFGITSEYWHLASRAIANGTTLEAGALLGKHGATGLGTGCHLHNEVKRGGVRIDPEPLMFGGSLTVITEGPRMKLPPGLQAVVRGEVAAGVRLRPSPWRPDDSIITSRQIIVQVLGSGVQGQPYVLGDSKGDRYAWVGFDGTAHFVAEPLVTDLRPAGLFGGYTSDSTTAAIAQEAEAASGHIARIQELAK